MPDALADSFSPWGPARDGATSLRQPGPAMALSAGNPDTLAEILRPDLALAVWLRPPPVALTREQVERVASVEMLVDRQDAGTRLAAALGVSDAQCAVGRLGEDAAQLAIRFAGILDCDRIRIRLEQVTTDACRKFHSDYVTARLLCTYYGPASQWVARATGHDMIHQLRTGDVAMFKGREWQPECPILHRSPPIAEAGDVRLLLVIDAGRTGPD